MKKGLKLLLIYLIYSIIGLLIGTFLYTLQVSVKNYIAGSPFVFFDFNIIKHSFFYIAACLILFISSVVTYSRIRYAGGFSQLIAFIIVSVLSWGLLFPLTLTVGRESIASNYQTESKLSSGYFRDIDDKTYYLMDSLEDKKEVSVLTIDKSQEGKVSLSTVDDDSFIGTKNSEYKDILIEQTFEAQRTYSHFIDFRCLLQSALSAWDKGISFWIGFLSLAIVLCAIYGLSSFFRWKLLNACLVMSSTLGILGLNSLFYSNGAAGFTSWKIFNNGFFHWMETFIDEPVIVLINLILALIFVITGIVKFFVNRKKAKKGETN